MHKSQYFLYGSFMFIDLDSNGMKEFLLYMRPCDETNDKLKSIDV